MGSNFCGFFYDPNNYTPYNLQWRYYEKFFFKSQVFFKRVLCSLDDIPACPAYRQAGAGRDYETIPQTQVQSEGVDLRNEAIEA